MSQFAKGGGVARLPLYSSGYVLGTKKEGPSSNFLLTSNVVFGGFSPTYPAGSQGVIVVTQDAIGGRLIDWNDKLSFVGPSNVNLNATSKTVIDVVKAPDGQWLASIRGLGSATGGGVSSGRGVPSGGLKGAVLRKVSGNDDDTFWSTLKAVDVGLENADNTADLKKPVSEAQKAALDKKADLKSPKFEGKVQTPSSTASSAGFRIVPGVTPTTVEEGDIWVSDGLRMRINGANLVLGPKTHVAVQDLQMSASDLYSPLEAQNVAAYMRVVRSGFVREIRASLLRASTAGRVEVRVNRNGITAFTTNLTINQGARTSVGATVPAVFANGSMYLNVDDEVSVDIVQPGTNAMGLVVSLVYEMPTTPVTGSNKELLFNNEGELGSVTGVLWDKATNTLTVPKLKVSGNIEGFTALTNPMTAMGDIIYGGANGAPTRLAIPTTANSFLSVVEGKPAYVALSSKTFGLEKVENTADADKKVASAGKWTTARTITFEGAATGTLELDGGADRKVTLSLATIEGLVAGTYDKVTINAKGQVTAGEKVPDTLVAGTYNRVTINKNGTITDASNSPFVWNNQTSSYSLKLSDAGNGILIGGTSPVNLTIPTDAEVLMEVGTRIVVVAQTAQTVTIVSATAKVLSGKGKKLSGQWGRAVLEKIAANSWLISGDVVA